MESEKDRLALIYDRILGGGGANLSTPDAVPPTPEAINFNDFPDEDGHGETRLDLPPKVARLIIQDTLAILEGTGARLSETRLKNIMTIVAEQVAEDAAAQLKEWRQKYALREEE